MLYQAVSVRASNNQCVGVAIVVNVEETTEGISHDDDQGVNIHVGMTPVDGLVLHMLTYIVLKIPGSLFLAFWGYQGQEM